MAAVVVVRVSHPLVEPMERGMLLLLVLLSLFGALAPDLDAPGAYLSRRMGPLWLLGRLLLSNPVTWWLLGGARTEPDQVDTQAESEVQGHGERNLSPRHSVATRLKTGRRRLRRLLGHRALSHSLVGMTLFAALIAILLLLASWATDVYLPIGQRRVLIALFPGAPPLPHDFSWGVAPPSWATAVTLRSTGAFLAGYVSHLLLDMTTVAGVPLLMPWSERRHFILPTALRIRSR